MLARASGLRWQTVENGGFYQAAACDHLAAGHPLSQRIAVAVLHGPFLVGRRDDAHAGQLTLQLSAVI